MNIRIQEFLSPGFRFFWVYTHKWNCWILWLLSAGGCDGCAKSGREELPHVLGQGQKPGRECQTATAQERLRGATLRLRSGGTAERRYPASEVRGGDKRSYPASEVRGCMQPGGDTLRPFKPEARGGGREELPHTPTPEAGGGGREDQPHAWGQGRWPGGPTPRRLCGHRRA